MSRTEQVETATTPLRAAMAVAVALFALAPVAAGEAAAQSRSNAQAQQTYRGPAPRTPPPVGRYVAETGEGFTLDRSGRNPLLRFDRRDETWVLRATPAPRGDVIYRNDAGDQLLRVSPNGAITVFTSRAPGGSPAAYSGAASALSAPTLGPTRLWTLMARRSEMISQALGRLVVINLTGERSESLCVEALITTTDAVIRIARSPGGAESLNRLRGITIVEGSRSGVSYSNGQLVVTVDPDQGAAGRPSSERVIRTLLPSR